MDDRRKHPNFLVEELQVGLYKLFIHIILESWKFGILGFLAENN